MKCYLTFAIFLELVKKERVTAKYLAQKFELSTRTVYRYISELDSAGIPTVTKVGKNGGLSIQKNFVLDRLLLTKEELCHLKQSLSCQGSNFLTDQILIKLNIHI